MMDILTPKKMIVIMLIKWCYTHYKMNNITKKIDEKINIKLPWEIKQKYQNL